jgi:hypothetical protein
MGVRQAGRRDEEVFWTDPRVIVKGTRSRGPVVFEQKRV